MSACVCGGVCALRWAEHKEIYLWDLFYWLVFKVARLWAAFPLFENMLLLAVSQRCIHLCRRLNYNPLIHLKSERSSGMLRRDNCQASLQTPSAPSTPQGEREGEGERKGGWTSVCSQTEPGVAEEEEGIICGTTLRAEPSATALLLPDHNQMCQVCPNRNDCVKAIFSNLSDFRVAPFPTRLPPPTPSICPPPLLPSAPCLLKDKYKCWRSTTIIFKRVAMNAHSTRRLQRSHVMKDIQCNGRTQEGQDKACSIDK